MGVSITGLGALKQRVQTIKANKQQALQAAGLTLLALDQQAIEQGGPGWVPFKKLPKRPHQLLWDTGTLIQSLNPGDAHNILTVNGDSVQVGTNLAYAVYQNEGTATIPARPFLVIDQQREEKARKAYIQRLLQGVQ